MHSQTCKPDVKGLHLHTKQASSSFSAHNCGAVLHYLCPSLQAEKARAMREVPVG
jgi:hypothetical protein